MIRIRRPLGVPAILLRKGKAKRRGLCSAYTRNPGAYRHGSGKFTFDSAVYGHPSVKAALVAAQHDKCCFCESKVTHVTYGDVEHFRPKGGYRQRAQDALTMPGYYWLAYEWTNLLFACPLCNQRQKASLFPLEDPANRATSHHDDLALETPLFINPAEEDPGEHLSFREEVACTVGDSPRGEATIEALGLNRQKLVERRRDVLDRLRLIHGIAVSRPPTSQAQKAKAFLETASMDSAEYAAMVRAALRRDFSAIV